MAWEKVKLGEICDFINGGAWSDKEYVSNGIAVLKVSNCRENGFDLSDISYLPEKVMTQYKKHELQLHDVIIATVGSHPNLVASAAGRSMIVDKSVEGYYLNQNAVCLRSKNQRTLNQRYLGYLCKTREFKHYIQSAGLGAASQMRIPISAIKKYEFNLRDIDVQNKIAAILSNYDDLIENNRRQVRLLEEAAQRLYKEWFVKFHFPGWEGTKMVDGLPVGWKKGRAEDFFDITIGKTPPRAQQEWFENAGQGVPWLSISDMGENNVFSFKTKESLTKEAVNKFHVNVLPQGTILVSFKLTVGRVVIAATDLCTNEAIAHFPINDEIKEAYTFLYLKNFSYDTLGSTSSISKAVNSKIIRAMPFIMPNDEILSLFTKQVAPIMKKLYCLQITILKLQEARDRLLPRLMREGS